MREWDQLNVAGSLRIPKRHTELIATDRAIVTSQREGSMVEELDAVLMQSDATVRSLLPSLVGGPARDQHVERRDGKRVGRAETMVHSFRRHGHPVEIIISAWSVRGMASCSSGTYTPIKRFAWVKVIIGSCDEVDPRR